MIVHLVLFKLKAGVSRDEARVREIVALFPGLPAAVPGIIDWKHGWNMTDRPIAYDYGLYSTFATIDDLQAYLPHPAHQAMVAKMKEVADWVICDYSVER